MARRYAFLCAYVSLFVLFSFLNSLLFFGQKAFFFMKYISTLGLAALFLFVSVNLLAQPTPKLQLDQDQALATQFFQNGDFEKAAALYKKLYDAQPNTHYYRQYFKSLLGLKQYERGGKVGEKTAKSQQNGCNLLRGLGTIVCFAKQNEEAKEQFDLALKNVKSGTVPMLGQIFFKMPAAMIMPSKLI